MKNRTGAGLRLVILVSLTCFAAKGFGQGTGSKVEIKGDYIIVHPGTKLSKPDSKALDDVLKQYDKALYKIEVYKNGQASSTSGTLQDMCIDRTVAAELTQAKSQGQSERAIQLIAPSTQEGSAVNPVQGSPTPGTAVNPVQTTPTPPSQSPVNPQMSPVNPQVSPVNPQTITDEATGGSSVNPQTSTPIPGASVNPQTSGTATNPQCAPSGAKASEFMQRLKPILEKYSR